MKIAMVIVLALLVGTAVMWGVSVARVRTAEDNWDVILWMGLTAILTFVELVLLIVWAVVA